MRRSYETPQDGARRCSAPAGAGAARGKQRHPLGPNRVNLHDFRKKFLGDLLDAIGDLSTVQKLVGHSDPATTARYDRRGERAMREAASHLHVPHYFGD
jgi:integrase